MDDFSPICNMCNSPYVEIQREGLQALYGQLQSNPGSKRTLAPFAENLLTLVSASRDMQVKRLACTSLCELSNEDAAQRVIADRSGSVALTQLLFDANQPLETRRRVAQTLVNVSDVLPKEVGTQIKSKACDTKKDARFEKILSELKMSV